MFGLLLGMQEEPSIPVRFSIPRPPSSAQVFLTGGRVVLAEAQAHAELLGRYGMAAGLLDQFRTVLDQYEQAINAKNSGTSSHVGANAELQELAVEIIRVVRLLDAVNRPRFRNDPEKRAAWKSARDIVRPAPKTESPPNPPGGEVSLPAQ